MSILAIDTVNIKSSVAIIDSDGNYHIEYNNIGNSHVESFFKVLDTLFSKYDYSYDKVNCLVVITGPGSFTGIRVGISAAQGIALVINKPVYGVNALEVQAYAISMLCKNNKKNIIGIIKNSQGIHTQLFTFNLLPLSAPEISSVKYSNDCITYKDCFLPDLDARHAGLLIYYKLKNNQQLNEAQALYLSGPKYVK